MSNQIKMGLALVALITGWFSFMTSTEKENVIAKPAHKIDYFLKEFNALSLNETGHPKQRLEAQYLEHFIDDDSTELTEPDMVIYSPDKPDLEIDSETGYISSDGELILLNGPVNIHRQAQKGSPALNIDTENLRVHMNNNFAETDAYAIVTSGENRVEGDGLNAHFKDPIHLKILNNTRGHHVIQ